VWGQMLRSDSALIRPLMYHSVSPHRDDPYCITVRPERFAAQMALIRRVGMRGVSIRELLAAQAQGAWKAARLIGLTFDDGYDDFIDYALPVLLRYGFTATAFVLAGRLGGDNAWNPQGPRKRLMTAAKLRAAVAAGMEIGSHGLLHVSLPSVSDHELADETGLSRILLQEASGQAVDGFCYPFGHVDNRTVSAVQAAGYDYACAIWRSDWPARYALTRTAVQDPHLLRRLVASGPRVLAESGPRVAAQKVAEIIGKRSR
jgi:peptidoglycan/xylan/chitin deacetylase (PgdA/CDA1 family)